MTLRRPRMAQSMRKSDHKRRRLQQRQSADRQLLLERLEARELLTSGPRLAGIQPNDGDLVREGDVREIAPRELYFQFNDLAAIDENTLSGVKITRSGGDGTFEAASVSSDLETNGQVVVEFTAKKTGEAGNGISITLTSSDHGVSDGPLVIVDGKSILVDLNTNIFNSSTASDLANALNNDAKASELLDTRVVRGNLIQNVAPNNLTLTLTGANAAFVSSNFAVSPQFELKLAAKKAGISGNGITINVTKTNRGGAVPPFVSVIDQSINIDLNSSIGNETTAQELLNSINNGPASALVSAVLVSGDPSEVLGNRNITYSPLVLTGANDIEIAPGFLGLNRSDREVVFRFAEALPDDRYRIDVLASGANALSNTRGEVFNDGKDVSVHFELDLGARVTSVVPQPITRNQFGQLTQARNQVHVYFNNDNLDPASAQNPNFYQLVLTQDTVRNSDDIVFTPTSVEYNANTDLAVLTFASDLEQLPVGGTQSVLEGTFRLRIGTDEAVPGMPVTLAVNSDPGSSFAAAMDLSGQWNTGTNPSQGAILTSEIVNTDGFDLDYPGAGDEPGHREISRLQDHLNQDADTTPGISTFFYNFQDEYGFDPQGGILRNAITSAQKTRAREVFDFYSASIGVQFIESATLGFTIVTGDMRALDPSALPGDGGRTSISDSETGLLILDLQDFDQPGSDQFGGIWFTTAMKEVGRLLGLGPTEELAPLTVAGNDAALAFGQAVEGVYPGNHDIVHGQYLYRPESNDIDLYRFRLTDDGSFSAETFAERLDTPSLVDTVLTLYRERPDLTRELVARNDDYFSEDSFLSLDLTAGTYYIGVSSTNNVDFNPELDNSGLGGTSGGNDPNTGKLQRRRLRIAVGLQPQRQ